MYIGAIYSLNKQMSRHIQVNRYLIRRLARQLACSSPVTLITVYRYSLVKDELIKLAVRRACTYVCTRISIRCCCSYVVLYPPPPVGNNNSLLIQPINGIKYSRVALNRAGALLCLIALLPLYFRFLRQQTPVVLAAHSRFSPILWLNTSAFDHDAVLESRRRNHKPVSLTVNRNVVKRNTTRFYKRRFYLLQIPSSFRICNSKFYLTRT